MSNNNPRKLKVYYGHHKRHYRKHPVIHLAGDYLAKLGFNIGDSIEIDQKQGQIIIVKSQK